MTVQRGLLLLLSAAVLAACGSPGTGAAAPDSSADVITVAEIKRSVAPNAYELVSALRPRWLHERATGIATGPEEVRVYVDRLGLGGIEVLRQLNVTNLAGLQYLDGNTATQRFGTGHGGGAILVTTKRR